MYLIVIELLKNSMETKDFSKSRIRVVFAVLSFWFIYDCVTLLHIFFFFQIKNVVKIFEIYRLGICKLHPKCTGADAKSAKYLFR